MFFYFFFCHNIAALVLFHDYFSNHSLSFIFLIFYFDLETHVALGGTLSYALLKGRTLGGSGRGGVLRFLVGGNRYFSRVLRDSLGPSLVCRLVSLSHSCFKVFLNVIERF